MPFVLCLDYNIRNTNFLTDNSCHNTCFQINRFRNDHTFQITGSE